MSFTTSPAMISPTTDGTNAVLPGISRRSVHLCCAPGGQIQCVRHDMDISSMGRVGCSSEYTTFSFFTLRLRHSIRITSASGQTFVLQLSATRNAAGSSLLPAPILLIIGI